MTFISTISTRSLRTWRFHIFDHDITNTLYKYHYDDLSYPRFICYLINVARISLRGDLQQSSTKDRTKHA